jgi:2-succinyl-6-hydroxy-2,4-cyclohexadiene-1-carboxylate synthase
MAHLDGIDIFYRDTGGDGPPVLCLHGRWGRGETWVDLMLRYRDRYRVLAPDLRGHGLSGKPESRYTGMEMASDMAGLLEYLAAKPAVVVGHSMGGHAAGCLAARYPDCVRALAILDKSAAGPETPDEVPSDRFVGEDPITTKWPIPFSTLAEAEACIRRDMDTETSYRHFLTSLVETVEGYDMLYSSRAIAANIAHYRAWFDLLPMIRCPVLLIKSKGEDVVKGVDFKRMKSMLPGCLAHEMSSPDHNVHVAERDEFYRYFDEFLRRI